MYLLTQLLYILSVIREPHLMVVGYTEIVSMIQKRAFLNLYETALLNLLLNNVFFSNITISNKKR